MLTMAEETIIKPSATTHERSASIPTMPPPITIAEMLIETKETIIKPLPTVIKPSASSPITPTPITSAG